METKDGKEAVYAKTRKEWRKWLEKNNQSDKPVLLILYHKKSEVPSVNYNDAVEEALCYGWIDHRANKRDDESYYLTFSKRKAKSNWSKRNIERAERLIENGLMTPQGQEFIDFAKQAGKWEK